MTSNCHLSFCAIIYSRTTCWCFMTHFIHKHNPNHDIKFADISTPSYAYACANKHHQNAHMCTCRHKQTYTQTHTLTHMHTRTNTPCHTHTHTYKHTHAHLLPRTHLHTRTNIKWHTNTHTNTHTHKNTPGIWIWGGVREELSDLSFSQRQHCHSPLQILADFQDSRLLREYDVLRKRDMVWISTCVCIYVCLWVCVCVYEYIYIHARVPQGPPLHAWKSCWLN